MYIKKKVSAAKISDSINNEYTDDDFTKLLRENLFDNDFLFNKIKEFVFKEKKKTIKKTIMSRNQQFLLLIGQAIKNNIYFNYVIANGE